MRLRDSVHGDRRAVMGGDKEDIQEMKGERIFCDSILVVCGCVIVLCILGIIGKLLGW